MAGRRDTHADHAPWETFKPTAYRVDVGKLWDLPLRRIDGSIEGVSPTATSVGEVLQSLAGQRIREVDPLVHRKTAAKVASGVEVKTDSGPVLLDGPEFSRWVFQALLGLQQRGVDWRNAEWFYYDSDSNTDDADVAHAFFVVANDRIVDEHATIIAKYNESSNATLFRPCNFSDPIWANDEEWHEARVRFWYRKFYRETRTGELMVLRPDEPVLHHYREARSRPDVAIATIQARLDSVLFLLKLTVIGMACLVVLFWRR